MSNTEQKTTRKKASGKKRAGSKKKSAAKPSRSRASKKSAAEAELKSTESSVPVKLNANPSIQNISALNDCLAERLQSDGPVELDISEVESADTASLQVLVAFVNSMRSSDRTIKWIGESRALTEISALTDLASYLSLGGEDSHNESDGLCPVF